jgi:hypothetical protein
MNVNVSFKYITGIRFGLVITKNKMKKMFQKGDWRMETKGKKTKTGRLTISYIWELALSQFHQI